VRWPLTEGGCRPVRPEEQSHDGQHVAGQDGRGGRARQRDRACRRLADAIRRRAVIAEGRDTAKLANANDGIDITAETVDVTDDGSIAALANRVGPVDHVVSTSSARARGKLGELDREKLHLSFDTTVIGPTMLAKYFAPQINPSAIRRGESEPPTTLRAPCCSR
jgi:hypothetical protein